jgi:hypothetical protein
MGELLELRYRDLGYTSTGCVTEPGFPHCHSLASSLHRGVRSCCFGEVSGGVVLRCSARGPMGQAPGSWVAPLPLAPGVRCARCHQACRAIFIWAPALGDHCCGAMTCVSMPAGRCHIVCNELEASWPVSIIRQTITLLLATTLLALNANNLHSHELMGIYRTSVSNKGF